MGILRDYRIDRSSPVLRGLYLDDQYSSRKIPYFFLLLPLILAGCGSVNPPLEKTTLPQEISGFTPTEQSPTGLVPSQTPRPTQTPPPTPLPTASPTSIPTPTASPTPLYPMDLSGYDPDIRPPIDVLHNPPLIAKSDETVNLVFDFANMFGFYFPISPIPKGVLYYAYGDAEAFQTIPLAYEIVDEMESLVARLPATDDKGSSLRYYAEYSVPEAGYTQRYPGAGTIDLFATDDLIPVELPSEVPVAPGEEVYDFFWGFGPEKVRQGTYEGYPRRVGPPAMDVSNDGRIALMDPVNERIIIFNPNKDSYTSFPLPFTYEFWADLAFDQNGQLMVCDFQGEEVEGSRVSIPYCYLLNPDGELDVSSPVYVESPSNMTKGLQILDYGDARLIAPFNSQGQANSREAQRQKDTWEFPKRYVEGQDPFLAHFADVKEGVAFEVHSVSPLGVITEFAKTPQGYIMTFFNGDRIRAVWIDPAGNVLKDVTLPNGDYSEINFNGQVAVAQDGSLYVLSSTKRGIEIHFVKAPYLSFHQLLPSRWNMKQSTTGLRDYSV